MNIGEDNTRVGMVTYSTYAENSFFLNTFYDKKQIKDQIRRTSYMGEYRNTQDGLLKVKNDQFTAINGDREDVPNVLVVITVGLSDLKQGNTIPAAIGNCKNVNSWVLY